MLVFDNNHTKRVVEAATASSEGLRSNKSKLSSIMMLPEVSSNIVVFDEHTYTYAYVCDDRENRVLSRESRADLNASLPKESYEYVEIYLICPEGVCIHIFG